MRAALSVTLCVLLVATAYAKDLELGQCNDDDVLLVDRNIRRPAIPFVSMTTKLIARAPVRSTISCISVKTTDGTDPDVMLIKGGVDQRFVLILVRGKRGEGLNLQFTARAHPRLTTTTSQPTTGSSALPTIPTGVPTAQPPVTSSPPETPAPTATPPTPSSAAPSTASPAPTVTSEPITIGTGIPQLDAKDGNDNDADEAELADLLSLDNLGED